MNDETSPQELHKLAINAALQCSWQEALDINNRLKELEPENTECLNRMAKAYFELGKYTDAKKIYQKVLEIDPYNTIAEKNFKRISAIKKDSDTPLLLLVCKVFRQHPFWTSQELLNQLT
jgi:tetratricopeptide (TPR) repeat protein